MISGLAGLAGLIIGAVCLVIVYDVAARNLGGQPPASTVALTEYALLYFTMGAAPWLVRQRGHIVVEVFVSKMGLSVKRFLRVATLLLCVTVSIAIAVLASLLALEAISRGEIEVRSLDTPRWVLFLPIAVGFLLMAAEFLRLLVIGGSVFPDDVDAGDRKQSF